MCLFNFSTIKQFICAVSARKKFTSIIGKCNSVASHVAPRGVFNRIRSIVVHRYQLTVGGFRRDIPERGLET